jgi:hypothetical protein
VTALGNCTNLINLGLRDTQVSDVTALGNCTNLTTLNLGSTQVSDVTWFLQLHQPDHAEPGWNLLWATAPT